MDEEADQPVLDEEVAAVLVSGLRCEWCGKDRPRGCMHATIVDPEVGFHGQTEVTAWLCHDCGAALKRWLTDAEWRKKVDGAVVLAQLRSGVRW